MSKSACFQNKTFVCCDDRLLYREGSQEAVKVGESCHLKRNVFWLKRVVLMNEQTMVQVVAPQVYRKVKSKHQLVEIVKQHPLFVMKYLSCVLMCDAACMRDQERKVQITKHLRITFLDCQDHD